MLASFSWLRATKPLPKTSRGVEIYSLSLEKSRPVGMKSIHITPIYSGINPKENRTFNLKFPELTVSYKIKDTFF